LLNTSYALSNSTPAILSGVRRKLAGQAIGQMIDQINGQPSAKEFSPVAWAGPWSIAREPMQFL